MCGSTQEANERGNGEIVGMRDKLRLDFDKLEQF